MKKNKVEDPEFSAFQAESARSLGVAEKEMNSFPRFPGGFRRKRGIE
jgi:hypothetical protein